MSNEGTLTSTSTPHSTGKRTNSVISPIESDPKITKMDVNESLDNNSHHDSSESLTSSPTSDTSNEGESINIDLTDENSSLSVWGTFLVKHMVQLQTEMRKNHAELKDDFKTCIDKSNATSETLIKVTCSVTKLKAENASLKEENRSLHEKVIKLEYCYDMDIRSLFKHCNGHCFISI